MSFSLPSESYFSCQLKVAGIISVTIGQVFEWKHDD